ncbi:MAG: hypothetical protein LBU23_02900, partial [Planctomycetota bacterium]|nr:hypothetical protein [Planctomycetota bacterium]
PYQWLDQCRQRVIDFQTELVAAKGVGPASGGDGEAAKLKLAARPFSSDYDDALSLCQRRF